MTVALSRPVLVTVSPSTASTTGRVRVSPTGVETLSISMTSPTATFSCFAPARTIAYTTAVSLIINVCPKVSGLQHTQLSGGTPGASRNGAPRRRTDDQ